MSEVSLKVEKFAKPIVEELGYELVEVEYAKKYTGYNLTLFIDSEKGITTDDCEKVSRALDQILEDEDPTNGESYIFNVSSMGLDRPLKTDRDFTKHLNKEIEVRFFKHINGKKSITGILESFDEKSINVKCGKEIINIERAQIAKAVLVIHF
ncbi:MAG: ribosome maturation factor RimP [Clostridia bacterium]|nr:ribosome maturation factor RimP [Clostridia bacterium]